MKIIYDKELDIRVPENLTFTDNGAYDLEQNGVIGRYSWIGFKHDSRAAINLQRAKKLENYVYDEVIPAFEELFGTKEIIVEDRTDTTDMFRVWVATYEN